MEGYPVNQDFSRDELGAEQASEPFGMFGQGEVSNADVLTPTDNDPVIAAAESLKQEDGSDNPENEPSFNSAKKRKLT